MQKTVKYMNEPNENAIESAVQVIKTAILESQARALQGVNQEQLALYYGIGRFISVTPEIMDGVKVLLRLSVCV